MYTHLEGQSVDDHVWPQFRVAAGLRGRDRQRELLVEDLQQLLRPDGLLQHPDAQVRLELHHLEKRLSGLVKFNVRFESVAMHSNFQIDGRHEK